MLSIAVAAAALLVTAMNIGCEGDVITTNARSSFSGFLTGIFSQAINSWL
jgi:hypothetical protein